VRKYTKSHEWIDYFPENKVARVGISNYAQQQLGEIIHVELPAVGKTLSAGDSTVVIESVKIAADVYTPVTGKITALNKEVEKNPSAVNDSAESSWLFEISYTA
jgi:glycine cleavage system H protein